jgi:hypothetical protein
MWIGCCGCVGKSLGGGDCYLCFTYLVCAKLGDELASARDYVIAVRGLVHLSALLAVVVTKFVILSHILDAIRTNCLTFLRICDNMEEW